MINHRLMPPLNPQRQSQIANGRRYNGAPGTLMSVPIIDAPILEANGWVYLMASGPTAARPSGMNHRVPGGLFFDETLGAIIAYDGAAWRDAITGAAV